MKNTWKQMVIFILCMAMAPFAIAEMGMDTEAEDTIQALRCEINLLNLINGLGLRKDQVEEVLSLARESNTLRLEAKQTSETMVQEAEKAFAALREVVKANQRIPKGIEQRASGLDIKLKDYYEEIYDRQNQIEQRLMSVLSNEQQMVLANYKNCLIPTPNLKDPVRVGQADSGNREMKMLERFRRMPAQMPVTEKNDLFTRHIAMVEKHKGPRSEDERAAYKRQLYDTIETARSMDDVTFEIEKERLAAQIKPKDKIAEAHAVLDSFQTFRGKPGKASRLLLGAGASEVLAARLDLLSTAAPGQTDLANIRSADSCLDGVCAIEGQGNIKPRKKQSWEK